MKARLLVLFLASLPLAAHAQKPEDIVRSQVGRSLVGAAFKPGDVLRVQVELRDTEGARPGETVAASKLTPPGNGADGCAQLVVSVRNRSRSDESLFFPRLWVHAAIGFPKRDYRFAVAGDELCAALAGAAGPVEAVARDENNHATSVVKEIANLAPGETKKAVLAVKVTGTDIVQNPGFQVFVEGEYRVVFSGPKMYRFF
jgi:hypothetical protein